MPVFYTLDFPDAEKVSRAVLVEAMPDMAQVVFEAADERVPVGPTGRLKKSLGIRIRRGGSEAHIGAFGARHAHLVMKGTRAHRIAARKGKAVRLGSEGAFVVRRSVAHPGARKQPFLEDALTASKDEVMDVLRQHGEEYLREAVGR